jgi:hypothetical protein
MFTKRKKTLRKYFSPVFNKNVSFYSPNQFFLTSDIQAF